jgi:hypothetical protein
MRIANAIRVISICFLLVIVLSMMSSCSTNQPEETPAITNTPTPAITVTPNLPTTEIYITAVDAEASETGPNPGRFYIYTKQPQCESSGVCADGWILVHFKIEGNATNGVDYEPIQDFAYALVGYPVVTPPSDAAAEYIDIIPIADHSVEGSETVKIVLENGRSAEVTIVDN